MEQEEQSNKGVEEEGEETESQSAPSPEQDQQTSEGTRDLGQYLDQQYEYMEETWDYYNNLATSYYEKWYKDYGEEEADEMYTDYMGKLYKQYSDQVEQLEDVVEEHQDIQAEWEQYYAQMHGGSGGGGQGQGTSSNEQYDASYERQMWEAAQYLHYLRQMLESQGQDYDKYIEDMRKQEPDNGLWWFDWVEYYNLQGEEAQRESIQPSVDEGVQEGPEDPTDKGKKKRRTFLEQFDVDYSLPPPLPPVKLMGPNSFRFFETKVLANFIKGTEEERMKKIREKLDQIKQVKPPVQASSLNLLREAKPEFESGSKDNLAMEITMVKDFSPKEWALKNALSFLHRKPVGTDSKSSTKQIRMTDVMDPKLRAFLLSSMKDKRRGGVGSQDPAGDVDSQVQRRVERAILRNIVGNAVPKYPLPRFILPRYKLMKKIEGEIIGPGSYEPDYYERERQKKLRSTPSPWKSCTSRFPKEKFSYPAAAFISDPHATWEAACEKKRNPGKVPLFQSRPCNFRQKNDFVGSGISPARYDVKSSIEELLKTKKSGRGIYHTGSTLDDFCIPSLGIGKKKVDGSSKLGPGSYNIGESLQKRFQSRCHNFKGKFSHSSRDKMASIRGVPPFPVDFGFPDPTAYKPYESEEWTQPAWTPFGVSDTGRKKPQNNTHVTCGKKLDYGYTNLIGPDFYFYREPGMKPDERKVVGHGMRSNFLSKTAMITPDSKTPALRERIRPVNYKWDQQAMHSNQ